MYNFFGEPPRTESRIKTMVLSTHVMFTVGGRRLIDVFTIYIFDHIKNVKPVVSLSLYFIWPKVHVITTIYDLIIVRRID